MTTTTYVPSDADRAQLPESYRKEPRYLGYRDSDAARPFAKYYRDKTEPIQTHVHDALLAGMAPAEHGYDVDDAARMLARPGYHHMETGWTRLDNGVTAIACHTDMPGVTAAMWDWWFGWLGGDSARYKLWHPEAHQFIAVGDDRSRDRSLTDRQRYVGNVSYADEYLGGVLYRLTIRFVDPTVLGIDESPDNTYIFARVGFSHLPLLFGWLIHQIRPTNDGAEMRTRFFLNHPQIIDVPAQSLPSSLLAQSLTRRTARQFANAALPRIGRRLLPRNIGHDLLYHCASEMNHLATFLPALYEEFQGTP
jgi:hypothetical protein